MNGYATHQLAKIRQHELIAEAEHLRLVKEARLASRGAAAPARRPLIWLRETVGGIAARLVTLKGAQTGNH
jgi:hypothetical protein